MKCESVPFVIIVLFLAGDLSGGCVGWNPCDPNQPEGVSEACQVDTQTPASTETPTPLTPASPTPIFSTPTSPTPTPPADSSPTPTSPPLDDECEVLTSSCDSLASFDATLEDYPIDVYPVKVVAGGLDTSEVSGSHSAILMSDGSVYAMGCNNFGQLGNSGVGQCGSCTALYVKEHSNDIASEGQFTVVLVNSNAVYFWGTLDSYVNPGEEPIMSETWVEVKIDSSECNLKSITAGLSHVLVLDECGDVYSWGCNSYGELGNDDTIECTADGINPASDVYKGMALQKIDGVQNIGEIAAGAFTSLALDNTGKLWQWGEMAGESYTSEPTLLSTDGLELEHIAAGSGHFLAMDTQGTVYGWGSNYQNQICDSNDVENCPYSGGIPAGYIGSPTALSYLVPELSEAGAFMSIASGARTSFVQTMDGSWWGWGSNESSQLPNGPSGFSCGPYASSTSISSLDSTFSHSIALDGTSVKSLGDLTYDCEVIR